MAKKRTPRPRRARGTGTIQRQADWSWIARTSDRSRSGRFQPGSEGYREAEEALERWNRAIGAGRNPNDSRQKVRDFAVTWLTEVATPPAVRPRTAEFYRRHIGYLTAYIGDYALEAVDEQLIERNLNKIAGDGLSEQSIDHIRAVAHNMFGVAKRWKLIPANPVADVPRRRVPPKGERALTPEQVGVLLAAVESDRLSALYHVALTLGLRRGELLGLRWEDVDFAAGVLRVCQQVTEGEDRKVGISPYTKSEDGRRVLPLPAGLAARLQARKAEDAAEARTFQQRATERAEARGEPIPLVRWNPGGLVFPSEVGTFIQPSNFNRRFAALVRRLGLPADTTPHSLRHTALTDLAAHGEAKAVQSIAGHADIETTMNLYAGRRMTAMRAAVEAVERERKTG